MEDLLEVYLLEIVIASRYKYEDIGVKYISYIGNLHSCYYTKMAILSMLTNSSCYWFLMNLW